MPMTNPLNADEIRKVVEDRLAAADRPGGIQETITIEWRDEKLSIPVISMPVEILRYNPDTHRIRAQVSVDPAKEAELKRHPYSESSQSYLHDLLRGDPSDPTKPDPSFQALKDDLEQHGQADPGIITRVGVLINGNTRRAALRELGSEHIRVGVLPVDASHEDQESIELSLQLRKDHKRDYSFMNFLLAVDERTTRGHTPASICDAFRIKLPTYQRSLWILSFVRDAIERSKVTAADGKPLSLRFVDFENDQGKLEELHRAYSALKSKSPNEAEALKEQRLLAMVLDKSKTDLRLIEPDFVQRYMANRMPAASPTLPVTVPGTSITVPGPTKEVEGLRKLTTQALKATSLTKASGLGEGKEAKEASELLNTLREALDKGLDAAGKNARIQKRKFAPGEKIADATDNLDDAAAAVADARSRGVFDASELDESLWALKAAIDRLRIVVLRGRTGDSDGIQWLRATGTIMTGEDS